MCKASCRSGVQTDVSEVQQPQKWCELEILDRMVDLPSFENLICILQNCRKKKNLAYAKYVHSYICNKGLEVYRAVENYIVPMFVECGSVSDAQQVFDRLLHRSVPSWTSLISGYIECGQLQHAFNLYKKMHEDGARPSTHTLVALLKACAKMKDIERGQEIHVEIAQKGFEKDVFVANTLLDMYAKCGSLVKAREVFDMLPVRNVVSWTALIAGFVEHGPGEEALKYFEEMQLEGISPNCITFVCILKACGSIGAIDKGRELHAVIAKKQFERDGFVGNTLVDMYARCGALADAHQVLDKLPVRNIVSCTALIAGYAEHGPGEEALKCYEWMQLEGVFPNAVTFVCILKACGSIRALGKGREIHLGILQKGFVRDVFVGNTLVDMYAKCGSLSEAREVFGKLPIRDAVSWNALAAGYAQHGPGEEALKCLELMQLEGISPNSVTFASVLKACGSLGALEKGREIHARIAQKGLEKDVFVGSILVDMYAKCGFLAKAQEAFDKLPVQNVVSWTSLIAGYAEHGPCQEALKCFEQMRLEGIFPNTVTFVCALKACGHIGAIEKGREIQMEITQEVFEREIFVGNSLVEMYARCGSLAEAQRIFDCLPARDIVSWNALIAGHAENGSCEESLKYFEQMQLEGTSPNAVTCLCILKACCSIGAIDKCREMHAYITQKGFESDAFVCNNLVDMYGKFGSLAEAQGVFDKLPVRNVVSWTALIAGYAEHGPGKEAVKCFEQMQLEGVSPNPVTFCSVLKACGSLGAIDKVQEIHADIAQQGSEREIFVGSTLVDMYAKLGSLVEAREIFDKMLDWNVVAWNALIAGYTEHGPRQEVLKCYEQMQLENVRPDVVTFVCVLKACGSIGAIDKGREIHTDVIEKGLDRDPSIHSSLVNMYAKCGSILEAWEAFKELPARDVVSWNAMIRGYGLNHESNMAIKCFEDMQEQGVKPNVITFTCLLAACSRAMLVPKGQEFFDVMRHQYGIAPTIDHYTCMVDLLAKSGNLYDAEFFVETMPCPPVWTALLTACTLYGDAELGLRCFQHLVQLDPECSVPYVLMANTYASAGRWGDAYKIEELRKFLRAKKKPASALIEVNTTVHEFVVGSNQSEKISERLQILSSRMKEEGHVPNVNVVMKHVPPQENTHANKMAIAFGLLYTSQGQTLRVTRNLWICYECHNIVKTISGIERCEILVQDAYLVHHFKDNLCSLSNLC